jgi:hypothetical protein
MLLADVSAAATVLGGSKSKWAGAAKVTTLAQVLAQCRLDHSGERRRSFLIPDVTFDSHGKIIGDCHGCTFHENSL